MAAEYGFVGDDTIYYYQGGFEPELADESPGWLSLAASLRLAIDQGYRSYDFLRGDESYKSSWRTVARPLVRVASWVTSARRACVTPLGACSELKGWAQPAPRGKG